MGNWLRTSLFSLALGLGGCVALDRPLCQAQCRSAAHSSSSLVQFLYPGGGAPPPDNALPELRVPLRVGLAFLPSTHASDGLNAATKEQLLERIRARFAQRKFVGDIVIIPDYYLSGRAGFEGLQGVQRLYGIDLMALVSYDQVAYEDTNKKSLAYLTIIGAYVMPGNRHDVSTLVDLAVVDPATRSLVLRAGGTDTRQGDSTLIDEARDLRRAAVASYGAATDQMIEHFDVALTKFEADVRAGKANVRVVGRDGRAAGGGGAIGWLTIMTLLTLVSLRRAVAA
jgi:rhombotail lipoprotein